jgi:hypothetical protein
MPKTKTTKEEFPIPELGIKRIRPFLKITCRDCLFLKNAGAYKDDKGNLRPCEYFGTVGQADPCRLFTTNPKNLTFPIGKILKDLSKVPNPDAVVAAFMATRRLKKFGFKLGQKVYFRVMGNDYLCNYASGYVIGSVQNKIIIEGCEKHTSQLYSTSILNEETWRKKLAHLLHLNKINDPKGGLRKVVNGNAVELRGFEPPKLSKSIAVKKSFSIKKRKAELPDVINLG